MEFGEGIVRGLLFQIGAGLVLVLSGVFIGMLIGGHKKVLVVRVPEGPAGKARSHRTASDLERLPLATRNVREAPPRPFADVVVVSPADLRVKATALARTWINGVTLDADPYRREQGLEIIRNGLRSGNEIEVLAGLQAFLGVLKVDFDRAPFRELVEPHLKAKDGWTRRNAWYALYNTGPEEGDLERVRLLADDPSREVRQSAAHLITMYEEGDLTGESGGLILYMLLEGDQAMRREVMRGIWGGNFSPGLEAKVIELSRSGDEAERHDAIYFALSTQANKSAGSVRRLIEVLGDPRWDNVDRAAWGLQRGVAPELAPMIASAAILMLEADSPERAWRYGLELLQRYAGPEQLDAIEALATREDLPDPILQQLSEVEFRAAGQR
jgi:hypothetical protein